MSDTTQKRERGMGTAIRVAVLSWSAALLTASYAGLLPKMDPTFIATVFTASAATFGVNTMKKGDDKDDAKSNSQPAVTAVEPNPVSATEPSASVAESTDSTNSEADNTVPVGRV